MRAQLAEIVKRARGREIKLQRLWSDCWNATWTRLRATVVRKEGSSSKERRIASARSLKFRADGVGDRPAGKIGKSSVSR